MKVSKKTDRKQDPADPYGLARLLAGHKARAKTFGEAIGMYARVLKQATVDQPLRAERIDALVDVAALVLSKLHQMNALPVDMPTGLTPTRAKIMRFINAAQETPSYREIAKHLGYASAGAIVKHIKVLARDGYLSITASGSRSIVVTPKGESIR